MTEFYIGQIFETEYPPEAAIWCNENNAMMEAIEGSGFKIVEVPVHIPTTEEIRQQREAYYKEHCDPLTCEKIRKTSIGIWTEEDEQNYINRMNDIKALVEHLYPYPTN